MGTAERMEVDLGGLAEQADAERDRLTERLAESCARIDASRPALVVARELVRDHPGPDGVLDAARRWTERDSSCRRISPLQNASPETKAERKPSATHGDDRLAPIS